MAMENERREGVETKGKKAETKHEKFLRLSSSRVNSAVKHINNLVSLSNTSNYDFSKDEVNQIFVYLDEAVANAKSAFDVSLNKRSSKKGFDFK